MNIFPSARSYHSQSTTILGGKVDMYLHTYLLTTSIYISTYYLTRTPTWQYAILSISNIDHGGRQRCKRRVYTVDWGELGHITTLLTPFIHGWRTGYKGRRGWYSKQPATEVILLVGIAIMQYNSNIYWLCFSANKLKQSYIEVI